MSGLFGIIAKKGIIDEPLKPVLRKIFLEMRKHDRYADIAEFGNATVLVSNLHRSDHSRNKGQYSVFIEGDLFSALPPGKLNVGAGISAGHINDNDLLSDILELKGEQLVHHIKGQYNVICRNNSDESYFVFNDILGIKPLYLWENNQFWLLSSELKYLRYLPFFETDIDRISLIEFFLFNFPLAERTFFLKVKLIRPGSILRFKGDRMEINTYFDHMSLFQDNLLSKNESLELLNSVFSEVVNSYLPRNDKFAISLTGGFDGRTILSVIRNPENLLTYTFGTHESSDIKVARQISEVLNLMHHTFYIDDHYYRESFFDCSEELVWRSDSLATFVRSHYIHAFRELERKCDVVLSGNGGSELFRVIYKGGAVVSPMFIELLMNSTDLRHTLVTHINDSLALRLIKGFTPAVREELIESVRTELDPYIFSVRKNRGMNLFLLQETIRKYFGIEMKIESFHALNRSPYIDKDFLIAINKTPFSSAYQSTLTRNPILRMKGQYLYSYVMERNHPLLARMKTNRGYSPHDVYSIWRNFRILIPYINKFLMKKENAFNTFMSAELFYSRHLNDPQTDNPFMNRALLTDMFRSQLWKGHLSDFAKAVSWSLWYHRLMGNQS
ncbi:MAG: hypothetical protein JW861_07695 [Bacteroidales bacterium]|nr:hypothetical protein [Bacteroidales bacterium]